MKTLNLPKISYRQKEIIDLLYKHRYLTRIQLQAFLKHKDKKNTYLWLKDLKAKGYIDWIYNKKSFIDKSTPAIYYLSKNAINRYRYHGVHEETELHKRYKDHDRSRSFIDRCLLFADVGVSLDTFEKTKNQIRTCFFYETEADYLGYGMYHFLAESEFIRPNLCFSKLQDDGWNEPEATESYVLEVFDAELPQYRLRYRLKQYVTFMDEELGTWEDETQGEPKPIILLVCARVTDLIYAKRRTRGLVTEIWDRDDEDRPDIRFTTMEKLKEQGIFGEVWERA